MNFVKFFMIALFVDAILFFSGSWYASQTGSSSPFSSDLAWFTTFVGTSGQVNETGISKYAPTSSTENVKSQNVIGFVTLPLKFIDIIVEFAKLIFNFLGAPVVILNAINTTGFLQIPDAIIVSFGAFWIFGEIAGIVQFLRGGSL